MCNAGASPGTASRPLMLQLEKLNRLARAAIDPPAWSTMEELEIVADEAILRLRRARLELARSRAERFASRLERRIDTSAVEYLDRPGHPEALKLRQIRWLHRQNVVLRSYHRFVRLVTPAIERAARALQRDVNVLELASGAGEMTLALARLTRARALPARIAGSDIVQSYVDDANRRAREASVPTEFRLLNAFDLARAVRPGEVDVALILQSMHHFTPGQLAKMIAQVGASGARSFVGIDGRRGILIVGMLPALCLLSLDRFFAHDALVSTRRFYAEAELQLIAEIAAPRARVEVRSDGPFVSMLSVEYDPRGSPA